MTANRNKLLTGVLLLLAAGVFVGWLYGYPERGLLIVALATLAWQVKRLLSFERAIRTNNFDDFRIGEGIWQQLYSRFRYERLRARKYKRSYQELLKEVRDSSNAMPDGGIVLNASFEVVTCNLAAQKLAGFKRKKDRGQRVDNILRAPRFIKYLRSDEFEGGVEIPSPILEGHWLFCRLVPYGGDQNLLFIRDITERRQLATIRREFVANASHELRSPLTVISGYLDTLSEDDGIPEDWKRPVEQMRAQASRMNNIVAELLELSKLEAKGQVSTETEVDVGALLTSARNAYKGIPGLPTIELEIQASGYLLGSATEIESVIANLLSNAIRHTPEAGQVTMTWSCDNTGARITVEDNGEGIAEEHLPRLTERFFRVDSGRARADGGIGLGLAIVKHVLLRHDAELEIESSLGQGSRFVCRFPKSRRSMDTRASSQQGAR